MTDFTPLLRSLMPGPRGEASAVVNPYRDADPALDRPGAARRRRLNLEAYLDRVGTPRVVLLGEAIGFRGGRFSGIAFTSERQLAGNAGDAGNAGREGREGRRLPWAGPPFQATSTRPELWLEPSASVVWGALGGDPRGVLLWNAFPWHPYDPRAAKGPLSNRTPERRLLTANLHVLEELLAATPEARKIAVGRTAQTALGLLGVEAPVLRHPAYGGAAIFRRQLAEVLDPPAQKPVLR